METHKRRPCVGRGHVEAEAGLGAMDPWANDHEKLAGEEQSCMLISGFPSAELWEKASYHFWAAMFVPVGHRILGISAQLSFWLGSHSTLEFSAQTYEQLLASQSPETDVRNGSWQSPETDVKNGSWLVFLGQMGPRLPFLWGLLTLFIPNSFLISSTLQEYLTIIYIRVWTLSEW